MTLSNGQQRGQFLPLMPASIGIDRQEPTTLVGDLLVVDRTYSDRLPSVVQPGLTNT